MRAVQEAFPTPSRLSVRRVVRSGRVRVLEGVDDHGGEVWRPAVVLRVDDDGRNLRDTRCYAQPSGPPAWRAPWVEPIG